MLVAAFFNPYAATAALMALMFAVLATT